MKEDIYGSNDNGIQAISLQQWQQLLQARGEDLWKLRNKILRQKHSWFRCFLNRRFRKRHQQPIFIITNLETFLKLEAEHNMDKLDLLARTNRPDDINKSESNPSVALPLTKCTGQNWIRQRKLVKQVFQTISQRSQMILLSQDEQNHFFDWPKNTMSSPDDSQSTIHRHHKIDLKAFYHIGICRWIVALFCGYDKYSNDVQLERIQHDIQITFGRYWKSIRMKTTQQDDKAMTRQYYQEIFTLLRQYLIFIDQQRENQHQDYYDDKSDIMIPILWRFKTLQQNNDNDDIISISDDEIIENTIYAMIAASDALQSLLLWTIWNLCRDESYWNSCRQETLLQFSEQQNAQPQLELELQELAHIKQQATQGQPVGYHNLSCLGCALMETVRVYPAIWTLTRVIKSINQNHKIYKLDILSINQACNRQWNPHIRNRTIKNLASFGIGKRSCPAGTTSLQAAYIILRQTLKRWKNVNECKAGHALHSAHLSPTLSIDGPQFFTVEIVC